MEELLRSKVILPRLRRETIARRRLFTRLDEGLSGRLILACAPAGYGKSTLIRDWQAARAGTIYASWFTLDAGDNDSARFASYLMASLERALPQLGETFQTARALAGSSAAAVFEPSNKGLAVLVNAFAALDKPLVMVLDDYHVITNYEVHKLLLVLLNYLPETVTIVVGTRVDLPLPLARLQSQGAMTSIRAVQLRFSAEEAADFLRLTMGLTLAEGAVALLVKRTEGWVSGLQLAGLSLQQREDVDAFLMEFAGDNHNIRSYLLDEVLAGQSEELQRFLLFTSVLERLTAPLCEAVLGNAQSEADSAVEQLQETIPAQQILEYLERHNLFTTPLDEHCEWYRYHTLFAELLRFHLWREHRDKIPEIQRRAARWLEQHGLSHSAHRAAPGMNGHAFARRQAGVLSAVHGDRSTEGALTEPLSEREKEVLALLANDFSYQEIAQRLFISLPTVKSHVMHIYGKLGVHTREQALERASACRLLNL